MSKDWQKDLGISLFAANQLEIRDDHLTGNLICPIISREVKEANPREMG